MNKLAFLLALVAAFGVLPAAQAKDKEAPASGEKNGESAEVTAAKEAVKEARKALVAAKKSGKQDEIKAAQAKLEEAEKALKEAKKNAGKPAAPSTK